MTEYEPYVPLEVQIKRDQVKEMQRQQLEATNRQRIGGELSALISRTKGLQLPTTSVHLEVMRPANFRERKFSTGKPQVAFQAGINGRLYYSWVIDEVLPAVLLPRAFAYTADTYVGDSRYPSGTETRYDTALVVDDGRIWFPTMDNRAPNIFRVINAHANQVADLELITMVSLKNAVEPLVQ